MLIKEFISPADGITRAIVGCEITGCMTLHPCNTAYPAIMQYVG